MKEKISIYLGLIIAYKNKAEKGYVDNVRRFDTTLSGTKFPCSEISVYAAGRGSEVPIKLYLISRVLLN